MTIVALTGVKQNCLCPRLQQWQTMTATMVLHMEQQWLGFGIGYWSQSSWLHWEEFALRKHQLDIWHRMIRQQQFQWNLVFQATQGYVASFFTFSWSLTLWTCLGLEAFGLSKKASATLDLCVYSGISLCTLLRSVPMAVDDQLEQGLLSAGGDTVSCKSCKQKPGDIDKYGLAELSIIVKWTKYGKNKVAQLVQSCWNIDF